MSAETGALVVAIKCGALAVGGAAVAALCAYGLYKLVEKLRTEDPHDHRTGDGGGCILTTVDDLVEENNNESKQNANNERRLDDRKIQELERKIARLEKELADARSFRNKGKEEMDMIINAKSPTRNEKVMIWLEEHQES